MDSVLYTLLVVVININLVLGLLAPVFTFVAVCDLVYKGKRSLPVVLYFAGFFGIFSFIYSLFTFIDGPRLPVWVSVPAIVGFVLIWVSMAYLKFRK